MDRTRFPEKPYLSKVVDLYRYKYSKRKVDLVLAVGDAATDLLLEYGEALFGDIPVVLISTEQKNLQRSLLKPNMISCVWGFDFGKTGTIIQELLPKTKNLYVISGTSLTDRKIKNLAVKALGELHSRFTIQYLDDFSAKDLLLKVARLPKNSAIFFLTLFRDANGQYFLPRKIMSDISEKANAPTFGIVDTYLGHGIVGGNLVSAGNQGKKYAKIAVKILSGEALTSLEFMEKDNQLMFDWRQLKRWSIDEDRLPSGSIVRYREPSIWVDHKREIVGVMAFLFIETFLIIILWIQITKRRKAEIKTRKGEVMYRTVADYTYDWEYWAAFDGTLYYNSPSCERISGYTAQEFVDNPSLIREIVVPEDRGIWDEHYCIAREAWEKRELEFRIQRRDSEIRWINHVC